MQDITWSQAIAGLSAEYGAVSDLVRSLDTDELLIPSGCKGWNNADLLFHMLLDAQRALVALNSPAEGPADKNYVTYWQGFQASDEGARAHARFVRLCAAAHSDARGIAVRWVETAEAAVTNARGASDLEFLTTQGHVLQAADFIATLVTEATVHHLDLLANLAGREPAKEAMMLTTLTMEGLIGAPMPTGWDDIAFVRKTTGRQELTRVDREGLGDAAAKIPVFS